MSNKILMKFTSKGRYETLKRCVQAYFNMANNTNNMVWIFTIDEDDETFQKEDFNVFLQNLKIDYIIYIGNSQGKIDAINRDVASISKDWDILLNISDDQLPIISGYDDIIRNTMPDNLDFSLWFNDGHQNDIITQEILGRKYYEDQGYIYFPKYKSFFCDNESTIVAKKKGKLIKSALCIIKHFHPHWGYNDHIQKDQLYITNDAYWEHDKNLFNQRNIGGVI